MYGGMIDLDELCTQPADWLSTKVNQEDSLLKFTNPYVLKNKHGKKPPVKRAPKIQVNFTQCSHLLSDRSAECQGVLDLISPPRFWDEEEVTWTQQVSPQPSHRCEIQILREKLDQHLVQSTARDFGVCPKRIYIYAEVFDELIRQVTITCAERGLMLLRVREEMKMTFTSYKVMFEDSLTYCDKRNIPLEDALIPLMEERDELLKEIDVIRKEYEYDHNGYDLTQRRIAEARFIENDTHKDSMKALKRTKVQLGKLIFLINKGPKSKEPVSTKILPVVVDDDKMKITMERLKRRKEKQLARERRKCFRVNRIKKLNEKLKKQFETDIVAMLKEQKNYADQLESDDNLTEDGVNS